MPIMIKIGKASSIRPIDTIPRSIIGNRNTVTRSLVIPHAAFIPKMKNFPINKSRQI